MSTSLPNAAATPGASSLADLPSAFELDRLVRKVLEEIGLGPVAATPAEDGEATPVDFRVLHFVILPHRSAWLDLMLEIDRPSARKIYETFSSESPAADSDLEDVLREIMNLVHGSLKSACKGAGLEAIIPLVPQSIDKGAVQFAPGDSALQSRHVFRAEGVALCLTLMAREAPVTHKELRDLRVAEVALDPLIVAGANPCVLVKKHTMLDQRTLERVHRAALNETAGRTLAVVGPSPLATLVPDI